jgi:hypothetical protein
VLICYFITDITKIQGKGKAILAEVWTGPEDSRKLRVPDFETIGTGVW